MTTASPPIGQESTHARNTIEAMMAAPRWLISREKKPYYCDGNLRNGELDTPNDIAKLVTYSEVKETIDNGGGQFELGFALGPDGNGGVWQGVDLDHVEANDLIELANNLPGYVERSRSGNGGHSIGYGREFKTLGSNGSGIEAYCKGRFFVVTTNMVRDAPLTDIAPFVEGDRYEKTRVED